ncbi:HAD-IA family hydrolase [Mesorhizobium sp. BR1-1-16]|uniref:HAD-IA family hydrolase n=1 Tax=Mesorhizobium sp. BR1-1-16 TaxID=2876653 RepID=UPI001CCDBBE6|nr:HAD-IA family hydrolase [Mesorhizobium sp. BR1-1-16]MBZ9936792.1 HAD-IA family hydrolase [Mesorhizobium sp. BR1-1-16]
MADRALFEGRSFAALLFDMDGTLLSSIEAAERIWSRWAARHGLDVEAFLPTIHGVRAVDTIRRLGLPGVDPEKEAAELTEAEMDDMGGIKPIPGAPAFLAALPANRWAIVTSAPHALARRRLAAAGLPLPEVLVAAEDVARGKPLPDCYHLAASRLGVTAADCAVFEDAPAGIAAGEASGAAVAVIAATHLEPMATPHPLIEHYDEIVVRLDAAQRIQLAARD